MVVLDIFNLPSIAVYKHAFCFNYSVSHSFILRISHDKVVIGSDQNVLISFNLTNHEDGTYMTTLFLTYPNILLYNIVVMSSITNSDPILYRGNVECRLITLMHFSEFTKTGEFCCL